MGLLEKLVPKVFKAKEPADQAVTQGYRTFTEYSPYFAAYDSHMYEQALTRSIVERIAVACSKLKPEFVTPDGSDGSIPRVQRLIGAWPNDMMTWPDFLRRVATILYAETVAYICPQYDERDATSVVGLWPVKPAYTEVVEYGGEPWIRFHLMTGETQAFPFYDVAILTRFQLDSDVYGGGNVPLTPTLRLMDAQRQAEEIALKTSADIKFIGKLTTNMQEDSLRKYRDRFAKDNFSGLNQSGLILHDNRIDSLTQVKSDHYTIDPDEMKRINDALYSYFGINESILHNTYDEAGWAAFYEGVIEPFALMLSQRLTWMLLTPTQVRKGNHIMFSSGYLEYATTDSKIKVATLYATTGTGTKNEIRDIFQLPRLPNGDVFMVRGEIYITDEDNNVIAESGGHGEHSTSYVDDLADLDEPDDGSDDMDDLTRALNAKVSQMIERRLKRLEP